MFNIDMKIEWCLVTTQHIHQPLYGQVQKLSIPLTRTDVNAIAQAIIVAEYTGEDVVVKGQYHVTAMPVSANSNAEFGYNVIPAAPRMLFSPVRFFVNPENSQLVMQVYQGSEWGEVVGRFDLEHICYELTQMKRHILGHTSLPDALHIDEGETDRGHLYRVGQQRHMLLVDDDNESIDLLLSGDNDRHFDRVVSAYKRCEADDTTATWWPTKATVN